MTVWCDYTLHAASASAMKVHKLMTYKTRSEYETDNGKYLCYTTQYTSAHGWKEPLYLNLMFIESPTTIIRTQSDQLQLWSGAQQKPMEQVTV